MNPWSKALGKWKKTIGKSDHEIAVLCKVTPQAVTLWRGGTIARKRLRRILERLSKGKVRANLANGAGTSAKRKRRVGRMPF